MHDALKTARHYDFGSYRIDAVQKILLRDGQPVSLTPKAFELLMTLVTRPGQIVEKDDLMDAVWPDTAVEESNLAFQISTLRKTLGDGFIETIPKRGYRFKPAVSDHSTPPTASLDVATPPRKLAIAGIGIAVVLATSAFFVFRERPIRSIAILPLQAPAGMEELGLGLADAVITRLGNSDRLRVLPTSAVYRYQGKQLDPVETGKQLRVEAVAQGMLQRSGDRVRVTFQLVRVDNGKHVMSGQFDHPWADLFALEDSLSANVSKALADRLTGAQQETLARHPGANAETHRLVLTGRYHHFRHNDLKSVEAFQQAIQRDDRYAPAWGGLSKAYFGACYDGLMAPREGMPKARDAALRAISLDSNLAQPHAALAFVQMWFDYDLPAARRSWERALQLDPDDRDGLDAKALEALFLGRFQESIALRKKELEANPVEPLAHLLVAISLYYSGAYEDALVYARKAVELDPNFGQSYQTLAIISRLQGKNDDFVANTLRENRMRNSDPAATAAAEQAYKRGGIKAWDEERLQQALNRQQRGQRVSPLTLANLYRNVGDDETALDWLEKAYDERIPNVMVIKTFPPWAPLRSNPRFQALLAKTGLQ